MLHYFKKVRFFHRWNLIFSFILASCTNTGKEESLAIIWSNGKAKGIFVPQKLLSAGSLDSAVQLLRIQLAKNKTAILGEHKGVENGIEFHPVIPLTPGLKYEVYWSGNLIGELSVPIANDEPEVIAVYPGTDTVPENLLKFYIRFSKPMQQGEALRHIRLIKNDRETLSSVFLDLQPELWNNDGNLLTLWLDPGRIKRGLQPNKLIGPPLQKYEHYKLLIEPNWRDANGVMLKRGYQKIFYTSIRDSISPDADKWSIEEPPAGSNKTMTISFHEPLDYVLLIHTIRIVDDEANEVKGAFNVIYNETALTFVPDETWKTGEYVLEIEPRLEDLAGNNLNHLFDADLDQKQPISKSVFKKSFRVK